MLTVRGLVRAVAAASLVGFVLRAPAVVAGLPSGEPAREVLRAAPAAWAFGVALALALFRFGPAALARLPAVPRWVIDVSLFAVTATLVRWVTRGAFGDRPIIGDEIVYDLTARRFAVDEVIRASEPLGEMERIRFMIDDGRNYPLFQPGWPAILALFWRAHVPAWGPAFATGAFVVATSRLADRLYGRLASLFAAAMVLSSAFVLILGASFFAHAWAAALFVFALERIVVALADRSVPAALSGGLAAALLFVTRAPTATALALVGASIALAYGLRRRSRVVLAFVVVALAGPLAQMAWNHATTGYARELPQDRYFALTEVNPDCHRLGFGADVGCRREHPDQVPAAGFTPERAVEVTSARWSVLRTSAWGTPLPFVFAALYLLRRWDRRTVVVVAATAAPVLVCFGFYYHAVMFGARLYYEMIAPLSIAIAAFLVAPFDDAIAFSRRSAKLVARIAATAAIAVLAVVGYDELTGDLRARFHHTGAGSMHAALSDHLDAQGVHRAIVYVENCHWPDVHDVELAMHIPLHDAHRERSDRWFVKDYGVLHDQQLALLHPDRRHVRLHCGWAVEDLPRPQSRAIVSELEAKFPADDQEGAYTYLAERKDAGNKAVWHVAFEQPGAVVRFRQWVPTDANYLVLTTFARTRAGGRFALFIDGVRVEPPFDARGPDALVQIPALTLRHLARGTHRMELRSIDAHGFAVDLDRLELQPR